MPSHTAPPKRKGANNRRFIAVIVAVNFVAAAKSLKSLVGGDGLEPPTLSV